MPKRLFALTPWLAALGVFAGIAAPTLAQELVRRPFDTANNRLLLADTLGAVHYLSIACSGRLDQGWRNHMGEMLQLEQLETYEREELIDAFNQGYRREEQHFPVCTSETVSKIGAQRRLKAKQGQVLSTALADPYLR